MYYFIDWVNTADGYCAALPEGTGYLMLAEPSHSSGHPTFGLFECELPEDVRASAEVEPVPDHLAELLNSAKDYPPALALTRDEVSEQHYHSKHDFGEELVMRLRLHLDEQRSAPFFLAAARVDECGYKRAGGYYWVVGYQNGTVAWVSRDYFVYHDPVEHFDLDPVELEQRFGKGGR